MKKLLKNFFRCLLFKLHQLKHNRFYQHVMKLNQLQNLFVDGEKEWIQYWSQFGVKANPIQYRIFSNYIKPDVRIVPEDICHDYIEPLLNPFRFVGYYADKNIFDKLFPKGVMPKTLLRKMGGFYYDSDYRQINITDYLVTNMIGLSPSGRAILKPSIDGMSGRNVHLLIPNASGSLYTADNQVINKDFLDDFGNDFIIQEAVEQSAYISQFNSTSVNTLRLSIYRSVKDNKCYLTGAIMRIGGKGSIVDNAHSGGCYIGINKDGSFCHEVLDQYGQRRTVFNDIDFKCNYFYPNWEKVVDFGISICDKILHHRLIALDIVLDKNDQPHLIEFNVLYYSSWLFQYTVGPAFGDFTDEIVEYCLAHKNELENILYY